MEKFPPFIPSGYSPGLGMGPTPYSCLILPSPNPSPHLTLLPELNQVCKEGSTKRPKEFQ